VRIAAAPSGKPRLADESVGRLRFNVAHSEDLVLCALTLDNEVGVDVERVREETDCDGIARRFFAPREARGLASLEPTARREAFFACWTRKEAIVKATGEGLRRALDSFVVSLDLDRAELLWAEPSLGPVSGWSLISLPLPATHRGAVAVRSSGVALRQWHWPEE
jgi:4'-phosphopantetheinyl transferase